jgi:hypothetical protein
MRIISYRLYTVSYQIWYEFFACFFLMSAKMSPHIRIGPEPVLADHVPSPPAAGSHSPAREVSAPHCGTEFRAREKKRAPQIFLTDCDFPHSFWKEIKFVGAVVCHISTDNHMSQIFFGYFFIGVRVYMLYMRLTRRSNINIHMYKF